jgi:carboxymethylenebutenolidase
MRSLALAATALVLAATAHAQSPDPHAGHDHAVSAAAVPAARDPRLPAGEETAKAALDTTPRHGEMLDVLLPDGTPVRTWISYPERPGRAGVVIVVHEIFGLSDWIRAVADRLAAEGFIAVAPDLSSGMGPGRGGTDAVASRDDVVKLVRGLTPEMTRVRLDAVHDWAVKLPASNGRAATVGFCWGGSASFAYAATQPRLRAAVVYYGTAPDSAMLVQIKAPVLGLYGGDDARVNVTIEPAKQALKRLGRVYETHVFDGAGHGFLRQQSGREGANLRATQKAWPLTVAFLRKHLE